MSNPFIKKLSGLADLTAADVRALAEVTTLPRCYASNQDIIREGDEPGPMLVILEGWACRYKILSNGARQIIGYLIPGDIGYIPIGRPTVMDHSILSITNTTIASLCEPRLENLTELYPSIKDALSMAHRTEEAIMRSWIVSMGRRNATERIAHLLCELYIRLKSVGCAMENQFAFPITQVTLADTLGITPVHVNRTLMDLRLSRIIEVYRAHLAIIDPRRLIDIAGFDDTYLTLFFNDRAGQSVIRDVHRAQIAQPSFHI